MSEISKKLASDHKIILKGSLTVRDPQALDDDADHQWFKEFVAVYNNEYSGARLTIICSSDQDIKYQIRNPMPYASYEDVLATVENLAGIYSRMGRMSDITASDILKLGFKRA